MEESQWQYGFLCWKPTLLQCMNRAGIYLILICLANNFQSMVVNGLIGVNLSSIERRFGFSSQQSSFIFNTYDMASVPMLIAVSFIGARSHRPRWVGIGQIILATGALIFVLPRIISPIYGLDDNIQKDDKLCTDRGNMTLCQEESVGPGGYLAIFIIGRILHGIGATPLYTLGVTFLDDSVEKSTFSLYVAFFYAAGVLGPALGYIGGGQFLNLFTDFDSVDTIRYSSDHPRWVGAWWLAFVVAAIPIYIFSVPILGFARDIPGAAEIRAKKKSEAHNVTSDIDLESTEGGWIESFQDLPGLFKGLFTNPTYLSLCVCAGCDSALISGFTAYGPKYVETQFSVAASTAGILFGIITIPGGAGGTIAGGVYIKKLLLSCTGILRSIIVINCLIILFAFLFFITCESPRMAGLDVGYLNSSDATINAACNALCNCTDVQYEPVCSLANVRYYSACHAGCQQTTENAGAKLFYNCSCISSVYNQTHDATSELCTSPSCRLMPLFIVLLFMVMFLIFFVSALYISAVVRSVRAREKSMAIGIQWIFLRIVGSIPGPIILGAAFDGSCTLWENRCGSTGSCLVYDNWRLAVYCFLACTAIKMFGTVMCIFGWIFYKPPPDDAIQDKVGESNVIKPQENCVTKF